MKRLFILVTSALLAAVLMTACGQRGPLYMPTPDAHQPNMHHTHKPVATPSATPTEKPKQ